MTNTLTKLESLKPEYLRVQRHSSKAAIVIGSATRVSYEDLTAACDELAEHPLVNSAVVSANGSLELVVNYGPSDGYSYPSDADRDGLRQLVPVKYTRQVNASASVQRDDNSRHTGTIITLRVNDGDLRGLRKQDIEQIEGVDRARLNATYIIFSMKEPSHDEDTITELVKKVAGALKAHVNGSVAVSDDELAALNSSLDYRPNRTNSGPVDV